MYIWLDTHISKGMVTQSGQPLSHASVPTDSSPILTKERHFLFSIGPKYFLFSLGPRHFLFSLGPIFLKFIWLYWWLANSYKRSRHFLFSLSPKKIHFLFSLSPKDTCLIVFTWPTKHQSLLIVVAGQIHKRSGHILFSCSNYEENKVWIIFYENLNLKMIERAIEQKRGLRFYLHLIHNELGRGGAET